MKFCWISVDIPLHLYFVYKNIFQNFSPILIPELMQARLTPTQNLNIPRHSTSNDPLLIHSTIKNTKFVPKKDFFKLFNTFHVILFCALLIPKFLNHVDLFHAHYDLKTHTNTLML